MPLKKILFYFALVIVNLGYLTAWAQQYPKGVQGKEMQVLKAVDAIILDGLLNEATWQQAPLADQFHQKFPYDTSMAVVKTEVRMSFDDTFIYIAATNYHRPGQGRNQYILNTLKRDFGIHQNDLFMVHLDPFNDKQNGFSFGVNAAGAQREGLIANGGGFGSGNMDWDNKWYSEVVSYDDRWVAEMAIPLKSIRYTEGIRTLRINFQRIDWAINEQSVWSWVPRNFDASNLAYTGSLTLEEPLAKTRRTFSLIPYAAAGVNQNYQTDQQSTYRTIGGDAKVAVSSSLNLDLTVNPDFSQVEVDRQVTNLSRFELFFPERRQFFLENSDLFSTFGFSRIRPFFSRRIGLAYSQATQGYVETPIVYGARLSGKINKDWRVGLMNAQTQGSENLGVEGLNYTVAAVQRQVFTRSNIGAIVVNQQSMQDSTGEFTLISNNYNRLVGLDYNLASADGRWTGKFFYHQSLTPGQPGDQYAHASYLGYSVPKFTIRWNHEYVGENYQISTGYLLRQGYWRIEPSVEYTFFPESRLINSLTVGVYNDQYYDQQWKRTDFTVQQITEVIFQNTSRLEVQFSDEYLYLFRDFDPTNFDGNLLLAGTDYRFRSALAAYSTDSRKKLTGALAGSVGQYFNGERVYAEASVGYRYQPLLILSAVVNYNKISLPEPFKPTELLLIGPRFDFSFTKSVFFTTLIQYNNQIQNINVNARLQWRFRPVSDLFIVYSDNYTSDSYLVKTRGLVMKLTYWL